MTDLHTAAKLALEALETTPVEYDYHGYPVDVEYDKKMIEAIATLRQAIAEAEQAQPVVCKPVAWIGFHTKTGRPEFAYDMPAPSVIRDFNMRPLVYGDTTPPQRFPLTSQERDARRWRFLMENSYDSESATQFHVWEHSWEPHSQTGEPTEWKQRVRGVALIYFIDRAIERANGIEENT